jgi:Transposase DDE domain
MPEAVSISTIEFNMQLFEPPAAASNRRPVAIDRQCARAQYCYPRSHDAEPPAGSLTILPKTVGRDEPLHLLVDSSGLKIYGEGEWLDQKRGIRSPRRWRKLHLGVDADTHEIVAVELTPDDVGDVSEVPALLDQIDAEIASLTADGAYDGEVVYDAVTTRHPGAKIIIPPRATAVANGTTTQRDRHIATIEKHGRMGWQRGSGYNRRSLVETAVYRYKTIIGRRLQARTLPTQRTEAKIGCNVLNRMTSFGMPASARIR